MANIIDYVEWRGDLDFNKDPLNLVDCVCYSQLAIINLTGLFSKCSLNLSDLFDCYAQNGRIELSLGAIVPYDINLLFKKMACCTRFKDTVACGYVYESDLNKKTQFSAITFDNDDYRLIAFSGTDDTIVGWEENFTLLNERPTYAQTQAVKYLKKQTDFDGQIYLLGHSKGGNLALYSFLHSDLKTAAKITKCICIDGPGLKESDFDCPVFKTYSKKAVSVLPESSIIGRLFCHKENELIVKSSHTGMFQHDCLSWEVNCNRFVTVDKRSELSIKIETLIKDIINKMDMQAKYIFVSSLFKMLYASDSLTLSDLETKRTSLLTSYVKLNKNEKKVFNSVMAQLIKDSSVRKMFASDLKHLRLSKAEFNEKRQHLLAEINV